MAINCDVDAIAPTGAGGREIAVLWAENRHSIGTSVPYGGINKTDDKPTSYRLPELGGACWKLRPPLSGLSHGAPPHRLDSLD
jgi:hypothetical protein